MYITNLYVVLNIDNIQGCGCECSVTESSVIVFKMKSKTVLYS